MHKCFPAFVYLHHVCLELELDNYEPVVDRQLWVLGNEPGSSVKAASALKHLAISSALFSSETGFRVI